MQGLGMNILLEDMEFLETLGEGSFGAVYRVRVPGQQEDMACKLFEGQHTSFSEDIQQEIDIMRLLRSKATPRTPIVRMHAFHLALSPDDPVPSFITMDLCRGGSLLDLLAVRTRLTEQEAALVTYRIAKALLFCHLQARVLHLDVKPANILLAERGSLDSARLADFGLSVQLPGNEDSVYTRPGAVGTPAFLAPEAKVRGHYSAAADTWSLGAVLFRMLMGHNPRPRPHQDYGFEVDFEQEGAAWKSLSTSARSLLQGMLCPNPALRLTLPQVNCNPWVLLKGGNPSMLSPVPTAAAALTVAPPHHADVAPCQKALPCPPGFEKLADHVKKTGTTQMAISTNILAGHSTAENTACNLYGKTAFSPPLASIPQDKHINGANAFNHVVRVHHGRQGPSCPPGFSTVLHVPTIKKTNGCHIDPSAVMENTLGAPSAGIRNSIKQPIARDDNTHHVRRAAPVCPPGFKAPMAAGCRSTYHETRSNMAGCLDQITCALQQL